jgi:hypothetical protein
MPKWQDGFHFYHLAILPFDSGGRAPTGAALQMPLSGGMGKITDYKLRITLPSSRAFFNTCASPLRVTDARQHWKKKTATYNMLQVAVLPVGVTGFEPVTLCL